jgi:hypothetical protein
MSNLRYLLALPAVLFLAGCGGSGPSDNDVNEAMRDVMRSRNLMMVGVGPSSVSGRSCSSQGSNQQFEAYRCNFTFSFRENNRDNSQEMSLVFVRSMQGGPWRVQR